MALTKRVLTNVDLVLRIDPAIIEAESDYVAYLEDFDRKHLKLSGDKPTEFTIAPMTYKQRMEMQQMENPLMRAEMVLRCGLRDVKNFAIEEGDKTTILEKPTMTRDRIFGSIVSQEWLQRADFNDEIFAGLLTAINALSEGQIKKA